MNTILRKYINPTSPMLRYNIFVRTKFSETNSFEATSEETMTKLLQKKFPKAKAIRVKDVSGGCGAMYNIYVETEDFKNVPIVKQHRTIYDTLKEQIQHMHGLQIETKVPT